MPSFTPLRTALAGGLVVRVAQAYTQVNMLPFMYKNIDPIVYPGEYNRSHLHTFFGSDAVTVSTSTSAELQEGCTTAENPNDLSVYWVPTLLYDSDGEWEPVPVMRFSAYYNLGETEAEVAIPQDLKMVAGEATAQSTDDMVADAKVEWFCEGDETTLDSNGFPDSTCSTHLQTLLYFPQCVNEDSLETAYKSSDYGTDNWCPEGMSSMPQLRFSIRYDLRDVMPDGWSGTAPLQLACGNAHCSHGDFINGWTEESATNMVATTTEKYDYLDVEGSLSESDCTPTDADPDHGTSDYEESVEVMQKRAVKAAGWSSRSRLARSPRSL